MTISLVKAPRQDVLDAVNLHRHVSGRESRDFRDGGGVHLFEIENNHLAVEGLQLLDQPGKALEIFAVAGVGLVVCLGGERFEFFERDEPGKRPALVQDVRGGYVMGDAIDPGAQGTASVKIAKTPPELQVNLLP